MHFSALKKNSFSYVKKLDIYFALRVGHCYMSKVGNVYDIVICIDIVYSQWDPEININKTDVQAFLSFFFFLLNRENLVILYN